MVILVPASVFVEVVLSGMVTVIVDWGMIYVTVTGGKVLDRELVFVALIPWLLTRALVLLALTPWVLDRERVVLAATSRRIFSTRLNARRACAVVHVRVVVDFLVVVIVE